MQAGTAVKAVPDDSTPAGLLNVVYGPVSMTFQPVEAASGKTRCVVWVGREGTGRIKAGVVWMLSADYEAMLNDAPEWNRETANEVTNPMTFRWE